MVMFGFESGAGSAVRLGASLADGGCNFAVYSRHAERIELCLFDATGTIELQRIALPDRRGDVHCGFMPDLPIGTRYGLRADGPFAPEQGHRFDPKKLLVDPYARQIDRPFVYAADLCLPRDRAVDTATLVPKAIITPHFVMPATAGLRAGHATRGTAGLDASRRWYDEERRLSGTHSRPELIYELNVRGFSRRHPDLPVELRGTIAALRHPAVLDHLTKLGVTAVELMPVAAWIDERHLPPLGLANAWGYNPVTMMALDPRLAPQGLAELAQTTAALQAAGIAVILDVVFNHSGESDALGPTVSFRGLDNASYYRLEPDDRSRYVNDTGCGNTLSLDRGPALRLTLDSLRLYAGECGIDGFRFDLATVLGRAPSGFDADAPLIAAIEADPLLSTRWMIAEPWDLGPGGYQLGAFPPRWSEWNDRYRDDVRRFWRGEPQARGALATRLAGSSDLFPQPRRRPSASINFVAAHDGFSLRDAVSYAEKHNGANGEGNRDGTSANHSWNNGVEGETSDPAVVAARRRDQRALLATLFLSRGTLMLTAGDEFGRTQGGNNNAYAQDNELGWLDWPAADQDLFDFTRRLVDLRRRLEPFLPDEQATGAADPNSGRRDLTWLAADGSPLDGRAWDTDSSVLGMLLAVAGDGSLGQRLVWFHAGREGPAEVRLPETAGGSTWQSVFDSSGDLAANAGVAGSMSLPPRSVVVLATEPAALQRRHGTDVGVVDRLAGAAGISSDWWSIAGERTAVSADTKIALLAAMGLPAATRGDAIDSLVTLARGRQARALPPNVVHRGDGRISLPIRFPARAGVRRVRLTVRAPDGHQTPIDVAPGALDSHRQLKIGGDAYVEAVFALPPQPFGTSTIAIADEMDATCHLVAAPSSAYLAPELAAGDRVFGIAAHLYSLRRRGDAGIGDFETLARACEASARCGAALFGINPLHHLSPADRSRRSPYHPSDRRFLDPIYIAVEPLVAEFGGDETRRWFAELEPGLSAQSAASHVDYVATWRSKRESLWRCWLDFARGSASSSRSELAAFRTAGGEAILRHARFETRHETRDPPHGYDQIVNGVAPDLGFEFPIFLQWIADRQLGEAARRGRAAGLGLGLYRDLAVGAAPDSGEVWANPASFMSGASIGAPPDPFSADGQVWNLPPFNPLALERTAAAAFTEIVRASMRHAGVLRIDHILGLSRLFVVPEGAKASEGAYLAQPDDLLFAVLAAESHAARTTVIGEDLGTVPDGLSARMRKERILSYRVLWFERDGTAFRPPSSYPSEAAACLSTHDLPTFAGWLAGRDIAIDRQLGRIDAAEEAVRTAARQTEISDLRKFAEAAPGRPAEHPTTSLASAAHGALASAPSQILLVQADDLAGETEPLNLPGTDREWQNWSRRISEPVETLCESPTAQPIIAAVKAGRAMASRK